MQNDDTFTFTMLGISTTILVFCVLIMMLAGGCTVSVGAEGRAFYPADKSPRKGFYDAGGMDGIYSAVRPPDRSLLLGVLTDGIYPNACRVF